MCPRDASGDPCLGVNAMIFPPEAFFRHRLPPAPKFVGRDVELRMLDDAWKSGFRGVLALVGLGGAGKTALAARFLEELTGAPETPRPAGLLVWSFYQEPDADVFLQETYRYFSRAGALVAPAKGTGLLHLLRECLSSGGPYLLVLDGLERVQQSAGAGTAIHGQIEDPLLRGLLTRVAEGLGNTTVLITSRFPLPDLQSSPGGGFRCVEVHGLDRSSAEELLRHRGVQGDPEAIRELIESYGAHALTLDHLGGLIGQFLDGDPRRAPEAPTLAEPGSDRQALRLARLLHAYEDYLPPAELALLCRLSILRRPMSEEQILQMFLCSPPVHARTSREIADIFVTHPGLDRYLDEEIRTQLATTIRELLEEEFCARTIAGPDESFRQEVYGVADSVLWMQERELDGDTYAEVAGLYSSDDLDRLTDRRPLGQADRQELVRSHARYVELRDHPLMPFPESKPGLEQISLAKWGKPRYASDLSPADVLKGFIKVEKRMRYLVGKHFALRWLRELCRLFQQKWAHAGALAPLDRTSMKDVLQSLRNRHLVVHDSDGAFSIHPAVRDHFSRIETGDCGAWHDIIRTQLISLVQRPGRRPPEDAAALNLVEEAIHHALEARRITDAWALFERVLGGLPHLAWKLGEIARGLRILRSFDPCPDRWALAWFLRALGEFEAAFAENDFPYFRADIRILQGRLPEAAAQGDSTRAALARFLMGQTRILPPDALAAVVPRAQLFLYLGRLDRAQWAATRDKFYQDVGWEGDRARCLLILAEAARRQSEPARCQEHLAAASAWILHSGSVEHLCPYHLVRAKLARVAGAFETAERALEEGLHMAREHGLGLYHVELLCEQADGLLERKDAVAAQEAAREALDRASAESCQFAWGAAEAGHVLGKAQSARQQWNDARATLQQALATRRQIGDPRAEVTQDLLGSLPG
jgi:hypothetical protein